MRSKLKELRIAGRHTVDDMASRFNISSSYYYKIESGTRNPTMNLAKNISDFFNKEIGEIFFTHAVDDSSKELA